MNKKANLERTRKTALVGVITALLAVSAFIRIPSPFVPFTMQNFIVFLAPMLAGPYVSFASVMLYILAGLSGIPVFANGGGPAYILQPTSGFLIGFLLSTIPNGILSYKSECIWRKAAGGTIALAVVLTVGSLGFWLNINHIQGKEMHMLTVLKLIVLPFLVPDTVKVAASVFIAHKYGRYFRNIRGM